MTPQQNNQRIIGVLTLLSGLISLGSMTVGLLAVDFNFDTFSNPVAILSNLTSNTALLIKWFMLTDMFGYYLLLLPILFYAHSRLASTTGWAPLITSSGFAYILIGAIGAAALSAAWPALMVSYQHAAPADKELYKAAFLLSNDLVVKGIWNVLEVWLAGIWWIGLGLCTIQSRPLKIITITLGAGCLLDGFGEAIGVPAVAETGLNIYLLLAIVWAIWIGIKMIRREYVFK